MWRPAVAAVLVTVLCAFLLLRVGATAAPLAASAPTSDFFLNRVADYDSTWRSIAPDTALLLNHNLGGNHNHYVVVLEQRSAADGINQCFLGGADLGLKSKGVVDLPSPVGSYWYGLDQTSVTVRREPEDEYAEHVRLRIWVVPNADFDSGWMPPLPDWDDDPGSGGNRVLSHLLGGSVDGYYVDFQLRSFQTDPQLGLHSRFSGGRTALSIFHDNSRVRLGAYWHGLDNVKIEIQRQEEDDDNLGKVSDAYAPEARVRIWRAPEATYDSGWNVMEPGESLPIGHSLGGNPDDYVLALDQQAPVEYGGHTNRHLGGDDLGDLRPADLEANDRTGVYWRSLNGQNVTVYRRPEDVFAATVRVRAWRPPLPPLPTPYPDGVRLYLPLVFNGC